MPSSRSTQPNSAPTALPPKTGRSNGHDPRGRFTPGNRCGKGNPAAQQTAALRQALRAAVSPEDITEIAEVLREMALDGNLAAIRLLLSYVVGRPGAEDRGDADQDPPAPDASAVPPAPELSPREEAPPVAAAVARPESPAPQAPRPPSGTVVNGPPPPPPPSPTADNGPGKRPPPSPAADNGERPPQWAIRRWPR